MADGAATDVGLGDLLHLNGAHHTREDAVALESLLKRESVHDRSEHADVVCLGAVHAFGRGSEPPEDVASADHDRDFDAVGLHDADLLGKRVEDLRVDTVAGVSHERLT